MTKINHRKKNKEPVNKRFKEREYNNGYSYPDNKNWQESMAEERKALDSAGKTDVNIIGYNQTGAPRIGKTDFLDKSLHGWGRKSSFANKRISASIGNDFTNGHRGMAKAVRGAKKFVRTRIRFAENQQLKKEVFNVS